MAGRVCTLMKRNRLSGWRLTMDSFAIFCVQLAP